jgi:hypothetical protein
MKTKQKKLDAARGESRRPAMRRFYLQRTKDISGMSGTGIVAEGVIFTNGWAALTWLTPLQCHAFYHSIAILEKIHGHDGATKIVFIDD